MRRRFHSLLLAGALALLVAACNRAPENEAAIRQALMDHLNKNTGLDMKEMDVTLSNVKFQGDQATAEVAFRPKSSPTTGMTMNYTLQRSGEKWTVQQRAGSSGHGTGAGAPGGMPPPDAGAHAPGATPPPTPGGALPPGHPPVNGQTAPPASK